MGPPSQPADFLTSDNFRAIADLVASLGIVGAVVTYKLQARAEAQAERRRLLFPVYEETRGLRDAVSEPWSPSAARKLIGAAETWFEKVDSMDARGDFLRAGRKARNVVAR